MLPFLQLKRISEWDEGTIGLLFINGMPTCFTLEPNDLENAQNVSSIPAQQYTVTRHQSPKFGETFHVNDVPDRSSVLFHSGNEERHTHGCILVGQTLMLDDDGNCYGIGNSKAAFHKFMQLMKDENVFRLSITEVP